MTQMKRPSIYILMFTGHSRCQKKQFSSLSDRYLSSLLSILTFIVSSAIGQLVGFKSSNPDTATAQLQGAHGVSGDQCVVHE